MNRRAQVTIFIILGVIIVAAIIAVFALRGGGLSTGPSELNPRQFIEKCAKDAADEAIEIMLPQGGYLNPGLSKMYDGNNVAYLCHTPKFFIGCVNQEPLYFEHLEREIEAYVRPRVDACFESVREENERDGSNVDIGAQTLEVNLVPGKVEILIDREMTLSNDAGVQSFSDFSTGIISPLYSLAEVANEVVNQETRFCNFEYLGFMLLHPEFEIDKKAIGEGRTSSKVYMIGDRRSGQTLNIMIRSCAFKVGS